MPSSPELRTPARRRLYPLRFSGAELAVIYQLILGDQLPGGNNLLADLGVSPADLDRARQSLLARRLLLSSADHRNVVLHPDTWPVLTTVLNPALLGMLQLTQPDQPTRLVNISWRPGIVVLNKVDPAGAHHLVPLASPAEVADALLRECGLEAQAAANGVSPAAASPEAVAEKASLRALFVATSNLGSPDPTAEAVSWLLSDGQLWLVAQHNENTAAMNRVTRDELHVLLEAFAQRVSETVAAPDQAETG
jgi:hypothetical protein